MVHEMAVWVGEHMSDVRAVVERYMGHGTRNTTTQQRSTPERNSECGMGGDAMTSADAVHAALAPIGMSGCDSVFPRSQRLQGSELDARMLISTSGMTQSAKGSARVRIRMAAEVRCFYLSLPSARSIGGMMWDDAGMKSDDSRDDRDAYGSTHMQIS